MLPWHLQHLVAEEGLTARALAERLAGEVGAIAVARGGAWLGGRRIGDPDELLPSGASFALRLPPASGYAELELVPADIAYEDQWLVALHKAQGWYVGATPWDVVGNALAALGRLLAARDGATPYLHLVHRLDRDTSGVLLFSKDPVVNPALQAAFAARAVQKRYRCLCASVPTWGSIELRTGHGRSAGGRWRVYELADVGQALPSGGGRVREAWSSFRLERSLPGAALVGATLHTGRTHQIRLHMAHLGHPLLGDTRYGGPAEYAGRALAGHLLHAETLRMPHPATGAELLISSPLPSAFTTLLES
jgi:23S rRNA pseudouridine1911/1915/1917 synthase